MTALPASTDFTGASVTEGGVKTAITSLRDYLAGLFGTDGTAATALATLGAGFPAGTRMVFRQSAAPTGWTKDTTASLNDAVMRIVTGTVGSGGSTAFSTWNAQTSVGATTLTEAQIPSHTHTPQVYGPDGGGGTANGGAPSFGEGKLTWSDVNAADSPVSWRDFSGTAANGSMRNAATGGSGSHVHSLTHDLKYYDFIVASKD